MSDNQEDLKNKNEDIKQPVEKKEVPSYITIEDSKKLIDHILQETDKKLSGLYDKITPTLKKLEEKITPKEVEVKKEEVSKSPIGDKQVVDNPIIKEEDNEEFFIPITKYNTAG